MSCFFARSRDKLNQLSKKIRGKYEANVQIISADLTVRNDLDEITNLVEIDSSISMLINNAGIASTSKFAEASVEEISSMLDLNVAALTELSLAAVKGFAERETGTIVNIASIVAINTSLLSPIYVASKAYVLALTQALHNELENTNIHVQAVLPGATATPLWDKAGLPVENLPAEWVMEAEAMVHAALRGLDMGEVITIPSLQDLQDWKKYEASREALFPNLSLSTPADRYL